MGWEFRSAAVPAAVVAGVPPAAPRARRPRDSRQDAGATKRRRYQSLLPGQRWFQLA